MLRLRFSWLILVAAIAVGSMVAPAHAANPTRQLAEAHKLMQNGAYVKAIEIISATLAVGNLAPDLNGRALLMRAQCNEKLGKTAFALADYNQALWMEGLSAADKKTAETGRKRVQSSLGVKENDGGDDDEAAARSAQAQQSRQKKEESGGFFSNLFGGSSQKEERPQQAVVAEVKPEQPQPRPVTKPVKAVTASTTNTAASPVHSLKVANKVEHTQAPRMAASATTTNTGSGEFAIQFAALLQEDLAIAEVNRIAKKFSGELGGRSPSVVIVPTKDGGTLYKIVAGPYPKAEGVATCEILKSKNVNCMIITHRQQ